MLKQIRSNLTIIGLLIFVPAVVVTLGLLMMLAGAVAMAP